MKLSWITDCHLNFVADPLIQSFCKKVMLEKPDAVVITGDISESPKIERHLKLLDKWLPVPVYFVCGNHDYYDGSIMGTRKMLIKEFGSKAGSNVKWLNDHGVITLAPGVALVGHDGWYDGMYSDYFASSLDMTDYHVIAELRGSFSRRPDQFDMIKQLAMQGASHFAKYVTEAFETHDTVYFATHVPPFRENSRAPDRTLSDKHWLPHMSSKIMGDMILDVMVGMPPEQNLVVMSGHTHTDWTHEPTPNIKSITGSARYSKPAVYRTFDL
jgi:predicted phosphodiesterase